MHGAELPNIEAPVLNPGPDLFMEKRPGRLQPLREPDNDHQRRENEKHDREREHEIDRAFDRAVEGIFQRLLPQPDEAKAIIVEVRHRMPELFLEVAHNHESHPELVAGSDQVAV